MLMAERDKKIYGLAKSFLVGLQVDGVTSDLVEKYLRLSETRPRFNTVPDIYKSILNSAQNANMKAAVIGKSIGGIDKLDKVLCGFQPSLILAKFTGGWEMILDEIENTLKPVGKIRRESRSIWPHYCQTILSAAKFMDQFQSAAAFYEWVDFFDKDDRARAALPMLLDKEIEGVGFALACDFLKELGYVNFGKPDVHIRDIFKSLNLCSSKADDYEIFNAVVRVAKNANVTPYDADKLFWLIGSGYFYEDEHIGDKGRIGNNKAKFAAYAKNKLGE